MNQQQAQLRRVRDIIIYFSSVVEAQEAEEDPHFELLLDAYLELKRVLAREFRGLATIALLNESPLLQETKLKVEDRILKLGSGRLPAKYLVIKGFVGVHPELLEYLALHVGKPVTASRLRMLTGDQVHTERRVRDLRDLGFEIAAKRTSGEDQYELKSVVPDIGQAAHIVVRKNVLDDSKLTNRERQELLDTIAEIF
jgi:hypothetical protein